MQIKQQTVLPPDVKITRLPPSSKPVKSLYSLEKAEERRLERESHLKAEAKHFEELLKQGHSVAEALQIISSGG